MTTKSKSKKPVLTSRRALMPRLLVGSKAPPSVRMLYEETWIEGNELRTKINYGYQIRTTPGFSDLNHRNKAEKKRCEEEMHPELYTMIQAAALLLQHIESVCVALDQKRGIKEK